MASNLHGTALVIGDRGILVTGNSGAGKTTLALALITAAQAAGRFAALVSDDQLFATAQSGRLLCSAPPAIAGLIEVRGATPQPIRNQPNAIIDLVVRLVAETEAPRFSEDLNGVIEGCAVACLVLGERNVQGAAPAIQSWLALRPFV